MTDVAYSTTNFASSLQTIVVGNSLAAISYLLNFGRSNDVLKYTHIEMIPLLSRIIILHVVFHVQNITLHSIIYIETTFVEFEKLGRIDNIVL
jgi:hypothetical protein